MDLLELTVVYKTMLKLSGLAWGIAAICPGLQEPAGCGKNLRALD